MKEFIVEKAASVSEFASEFNFEELRPYYDSEVPNVMKRMIQDPIYYTLMEYLWPGISKEESIKKAGSVNSVRDFQTTFMSHAIWHIVNNTSDGLTWSGIEKLDKNKSYLYIANHRDILLDSAILQIIFDKEGFATSEITFGSNLMEKGFITDFGKLNRMFMVKREGTAKELYDISKQLSAYIRHTIKDKNVSVWIAQRNGRTKDGNDITQTGLLKMLALSNGKNFISNFSDLNIVPVSISYELEPCDFLKAQELHLSSLHSKYVKAQGEDLNSILTGIRQPKGKIHMSFGHPIKEELVEVEKTQNENEKYKLLSAIIDKQIYHNFKLYPTHYIAYDLMHGENIFHNSYTSQEKEKFGCYVEKGLSGIKGEKELLRQILYKMYSMPVENKLKLSKN